MSFIDRLLDIFKKRKVYSSFRDNILRVDLADMHSLSKYNKGIQYLLCAIDRFSKYAWVVSLKDKRRTIIVYAFPKIISKGHKPNKIWVDHQSGEFYKKLLKRFLKINNIEMYSTYNEGKSAVAEKFIRILKNKIVKRMTAISKIVYFNTLDDIVNKCNNTVHKTIKMKPIDVTYDSYAEYEDSYETKPIFKVGHQVTISKIKDTVPWNQVINDLNGERITGRFYEKELQKTNQKEFRIEKLIKRKDNRLYVKWKGYDNSFTSWINEQDLV